MRVTARLTTILISALLLTVAASPAASSQDPGAAEVPSPICDLLTAPEVSEALSVEVAITDSWDVTCQYDSVDPSEEFFVGSNVDPATLAHRKTVFTGETVDVDGKEGLYSDTVPTLFVATPDGGTWTLLVIGTIPDGVDAKTAMTALARLAMSRLPAIGRLPTALPVEPEPSFAQTQELEAKFPTEVGGVPLTVSSFSFADVGETIDAYPALQAALDAAGKTLADVRIGVGFVLDPAGQISSITAVQVKGADAAALTSVLLPTVFTDRALGAEAPVQIAGKDVTSLDVDGTTTYLHAQDDILWAVTAVEPALTEILQKLP
jgi:hypothetical protein